MEPSTMPADDWLAAMSSASRSLKERFESFVHTLHGYEPIDGLPEGRNFPGKKRADYFFNNRKIIVEQKALEADPVDKPQKFANRLIEQRGILVFGQVSTKFIFDKQSDGQKLQHELILRLTRGIESIISNADKQTRDTREIFETPDATGIVLILNESAHTLSPDIMHYGLAHIFRQTAGGNLIRYPHNDGIILISEAHIIKNAASKKLFPILTFTSPHGNRQAAVIEFSNMLMEKWAQYNRIPFLRPARKAD